MMIFCDFVKNQQKKGVFFVYNSHDLAISIKNEAKIKKIQVKEMLEKCGLGSNTMSAMYHGKSIAFDSLAKIADYLDCSIDFLLGRTKDELNEPEDEHRLIKAYRQLTEEGQRAILTTAELYASSPQYQKYTDISKDA